MLNVRKREISQAVDANPAATWSSGTKEGLNRSLLVIPAQAGLSTAELVIQPFQQIAEELDPSLRWDDGLFTGSLKVVRNRRLGGIDQIACPARNCSGSSRSRIIVASILYLEQAHLPPFPVAADEGIVGACQ